jgi:hypothetical protein
MTELVNPNDLLSVQQAARVRGLTRQGINYLIKEGKLKTVDIAGHHFIHKDDLAAFKPDKGGRPRKKD